ncbi:MAG TPA: enoyl-CoA hydratase-related protein [Polyangiaceae bacterium]|nr:enoyl-CoA hydratase-related protein [Polyangiaceae bacterium]
MESSDVLLIEREGAVARLTLNRPSTRNALNEELIRRLRAAVLEVGEDPSVRAVILGASGEGFCSGADLREGLSASPDRTLDERIDELHDVVRGIVHAPKPFVAEVNGGAVGFGADLALACDLRVLSSTGYIQEKFVKIGLMPDGGGTFWMPRLVGIGRALEYLMLGTKIEASLALELGLANRVVEPSALSETSAELAQELAKGPPLALAQIRKAVRESFSGTIDDALKREKSGQIGLLQSADLMEGVLAWVQRRDPKFSGK